MHPSTRGQNFLLTVIIKDLNYLAISNKKTLSQHSKFTTHLHKNFSTHLHHKFFFFKIYNTSTPKIFSQPIYLFIVKLQVQSQVKVLVKVQCLIHGLGSGLNSETQNSMSNTQKRTWRDTIIKQATHHPSPPANFLQLLPKLI